MHFVTSSLKEAEFALYPCVFLFLFLDLSGSGELLKKRCLFKNRIIVKALNQDCKHPLPTFPTLLNHHSAFHPPARASGGWEADHKLGHLSSGTFYKDCVSRKRLRPHASRKKTNSRGKKKNTPMYREWSVIKPWLMAHCQYDYLINLEIVFDFA